MYSVHPYFSLKNLGKKACIIQGKIQYIFFKSTSTYWCIIDIQENVAVVTIQVMGFDR